MYSEKNHIIGVDKIKTTTSMHNVYFNKSHDFFIGDVTDYNFISKMFLLFKPSKVICLSSSESISEEICGLENLIKCSNGSKLVYVSNTNVYKDNKKNNEDSIVFPKTHESAKKICAESLILSSKTPYTIFRASEVFGPRQFFGFIPDICRSFDAGSIVLDNESKVRDLLYVEDLCNAIHMFSKEEFSEIYNISINNDFTDLEIISMTDKQLKIINNNKIFNNFEIDTNKIKEKGWKPLRKFRDQIKFTFKWFENNKWALSDY